MAETVRRKDISAIEGSCIVAEAATWKGTPYSLVGSASAKGVGGDCSGTTSKIYESAHFPYIHQASGTFAAYALSSGLFRKLGPSELKQEGDILCWDDHLAIYSFANDSDNATAPRVNNKTTPRRLGRRRMTCGLPRILTAEAHTVPNEMRWFKPAAPKVFRYQK